MEKIPQSEVGKAREKAAQAVGVNPRYVSDAKYIRKVAPHLPNEAATVLKRVQICPIKMPLECGTSLPVCL